MISGELGSSCASDRPLSTTAFLRVALGGHSFLLYCTCELRVDVSSNLHSPQSQVEVLIYFSHKPFVIVDKMFTPPATNGNQF